LACLKIDEPLAEQCVLDQVCLYSPNIQPNNSLVYDEQSECKMLSNSSNFIGREQETNKCLGLLDTGRLGSQLCLNGDFCLQID
jgi:hypothetical protein